MPAFVETASGSILMNAIGTDIWGNADQFRFAYKTLNGNGTMVARVESLYNSNVWAKGGVMIRQSIEPGSTHAFMAITPGGSGAGNGASFQQRLAADGASTNNDNTGAVVAAPYWVKIERNGNNFTGSISPDGKTWTQLGTAQTITMTGPVLIGLAVCSHDAAIVDRRGVLRHRHHRQRHRRLAGGGDRRRAAGRQLGRRPVRHGQGQLRQDQDGREPGCRGHRCDRAGSSGRSR